MVDEIFCSCPLDGGELRRADLGLGRGRRACGGDERINFLRRVKRAMPQTQSEYLLYARGASTDGMSRTLPQCTG
jgi:hypothetical protein